MMRRPLSTLAPVAIGGILVLGAAVAAAAVLGSRSTGAHGGRAAVAPLTRTWTLSMSAAPGDLALAEVSFPRAHRGQLLSARSLQVAVGEPFGDDYLAAAALRLQGAGAPRLLAVLVNRHLQ
jgi:hypothetical protein